ncbi:MAG: LysR family transcriptional regulator [Pseudomonadota bacterium]
MKLDPRHLEILAAIVDQGGLTEGAAHLGKSQPSVSRTLTQLETRIGEPLFLPGKRPLQPTELGRALAEHGRAVLAANAAASVVVTRHQGGTAGIVRLGGTPIFMDGVIAPMIGEFQRQCPEVRVDQSYAYAPDLLARLEQGSLDLAITPMRPSALPDNVAFRGFLPGLNVIACRDAHPLVRRTLVTAADIAAFPWIAPPAESPLYRDLQLALSNLGVLDFKISFSGGTLASVLSILTTSDALTVLPYSVVFMMRRQAAIATLSLSIGHPDRDLGMMHTKTTRLSPAARRLQRFLSKEFETLAQTIVHHQQNTLWRA